MFERDMGRVGPTVGSVLVTGAGGTIGTAFVRELLAISPLARVTALDYDESRLTMMVRIVRDAYPHAWLDVIPSDVRHMQQSEYDYVAHFAAMKHVRTEGSVAGIARMCDENIAGLAAVLDRVEADRVFLMSTDKAADPTTVMGMTKAICERMLATSGRDCTAARMGNVAGSNGSLLEWAAKSTTRVHVPRGIRRWLFTPQDAARLALLAVFAADPRTILVPASNPNHQRLLTDVAREAAHRAVVVEVDPDPADKILEVLSGRDETVDYTGWHSVGVLPLPHTSEVDRYA